MGETIESIDQLSPQLLTRLLREGHELEWPTIHAIHVEKLDAWNSHAFKLRLTYLEEARAAPAQLFLKLKSKHYGKEEHEFYSYIMRAAVGLPMLVPCYSSAYDPETGASHLLLADLSDTHFTPFTIAQFRALQVVPQPIYLEQIIDCIADFHAHWWEHQLLGSGFAAVGPSLASKEAYDARLDKRGGELDAFLRTVGDRVPTSTVRLLKDAHSYLPTLWDRYFAERIAARRSLTLIQGDCYFIQFLCPYRPDLHRTHLIDLDSVNAYPPTADLVYMFATFWTREQRAEGGREKRALERYHQRLGECGVTGYTFGDMILDYRLSIADNLLHPVWDQQNGASESYWRPKLNCVVEAFEDWACIDLLK